MENIVEKKLSDLAAGKESTAGRESAMPKLNLVFGDVVLGVHGDGFDYLFSYQTGGPESLVIDGKEWLYRTPKPTFWRAATDNDKGCGFPFGSAMWMGADLYSRTEKIRVFVDGTDVEPFRAPANNRFAGAVTADEVTIQYTYRTATEPSTTVDVSYTVTGDGRIRVEVHYHGKQGLPELPVFGMRFIMPTKAVGYTYQGLSGETYPDRMAGGEKGIFEVDGLPVTPYLVPQDCGMHMETEWLQVTRDRVLANERRACRGAEQRACNVTGQCDAATGRELFTLTFGNTGKPFAFSCLPYTAEELENATHQEELPPARRTVVCILGAVRGVGGIDSWGSDVEKDWHIDAEADIEYSFWMGPGK